MRKFSCGVFSMLMSLCEGVSPLPEPCDALSLVMVAVFWMPFGAGHWQFSEFLQAMNYCIDERAAQPPLKPAFLLPFPYAPGPCLSCLAPGAFSSQSWFSWCKTTLPSSWAMQKLKYWGGNCRCLNGGCSFTSKTSKILLMQERMLMVVWGIITLEEEISLDGSIPCVFVPSCTTSALSGCYEAAGRTPISSWGPAAHPKLSELSPCSFWCFFGPEETWEAWAI